MQYSKHLYETTIRRHKMVNSIFFFNYTFDLHQMRNSIIQYFNIEVNSYIFLKITIQFYLFMTVLHDSAYNSITFLKRRN